jgi:hypothetical protein
MPITHRPLPRYKGRIIDNTDLIEAFDQVGYKLSQTLTLVDSIQNQSNEQVLLNHNRSTRPFWACHPIRLDTDLVVSATPKGRTVRLCPVPTPSLRPSKYQVPTEGCQAFPYGLKNTASEYTYHTPHLFMGPTKQDHVSDLYFLDIPRPSPGNTVNMVGIRNIMKVQFVHCSRMATLALDLHDLSTPRLYTSTTTSMIRIHYHTLWVSL